jgi:LysM repeat protein
MLFRILLIFLLTLFQSNSYSDPFTNEIGITRQPEVVEVKPEETIEAEEELIAENDNNDQEIIEEQPIEAEETIEVAEAEPQTTELVTILNIDPIVAYSLKDYLLKGVALSKESEHKFQRAKIRKFDRAKTPTTHTILENETVEQIAFRYGFSLREIELANAIYPGSRKLVVGDKIVIPSRFHIVKEGQNLTTIADRYNLNVTQLASYNDLDEESCIIN